MPTKPRALLVVATVALLGSSCTRSSAAGERGKQLSAAERTKRGLKTAIFAGGCFWCMQPPFDKLDGVVSTTVGYAGGKERDPSYEQVAHGQTGHAESIEVVYDPAKVSYQRLLDLFWRNIDPTDAGGQFVDRGRQYRPAIFYLDARQKKIAITSRHRLAKSKRFGKPLAVQIVAATRFWPAESYHQKFYKKNPGHYYRYRSGSGRDAFLRRIWGAARH